REEPVPREPRVPLADDLRAGLRHRRHHQRSLGAEPTEPLGERGRRDRLADGDRVEPAGADAAAPWRAAEAQTRTHVEGHAADEASDHRRRRIDEHERYEARRRVERVHQEAASFSAAAVASSRLRSTSFIERSRSASRATTRGSAKTTAHRANGRGIMNASQLRSRRAGRAATATGTTGAPVRAASVTTPGWSRR